ncbi:rhodanese-related sulfurtransferase [Oxynema sp. CENA135]|uniref:rhodanese-like domain-containing protein n=1 Tax=Oxynema sp. CENA135 TaxID=984206 RepID=UPI00190C76AF|nr:rhodanese-like domain-containing protein [Oxynema sp. CENA135]MBK4732455.1 rhodanese-related sulfurtransferase [Oxynema sp. CENA135]
MSTASWNQPLPQISVEELARRLAEAPDGLQLIDVREPQEVAIAAIDGFEVLPLSQFEQWSADIRQRFDPDAETLVLCHHGIRSAQMSQWLIAQGFSQVKNISGGIDAYSNRVDPSVPRY